MKKSKIILTILFIIILQKTFADQTSDKKIRIKKIIYLSPEVLDKKVLMTYLDFKEGMVVTEKMLTLMTETAKMRLENLEAFFEINIFTKDSEKSPGEKIVYIKLQNGWQNIYGAGLYFFTWGKRNFLHRDDYIGFNLGINKNTFSAKHHFPVGWLYFSHETGWKWRMNVTFLPFFPLYGGAGQRYIHNLFSEGKLTFKLLPDIKFGLYAGVLVNFTNSLSTINYYITPDFTYRRTGFPMGGFIEIDQSYLREKYKFGYKINIKGGVNLDAINTSTFFPLQSELVLYCFPNEHVNFIHKLRLHNQFNNPPEYLEIDANDTEIQRGNILENEKGDFLFTTNLDCIIAFHKFTLKVGNIAFGCQFFYDGTLLTRNADLAEADYNSIYYYNTIGTGLWVKFGGPFSLTLFFNYGYAIMNQGKFSVSLVVGKL